MYGFHTFKLTTKGDAEKSLLFTMPEFDIFKMNVTSSSHDHNLEINFFLDATGSTDTEVKEKLQEKLKNLKLYLNLHTDYKFDVQSMGNLIRTFPNEDECKKRVPLTLNSLKNPNLFNFIDRDFSQSLLTLQIALNQLDENKIFDGFSNLINWLYDYDKKSAKKYCCIRDCSSHVKLDVKRTMKDVNLNFKDQFEFDNENILKRDSEKNINSLKNHLPEVRRLVKKAFSENFVQS